VTRKEVALSRNLFAFRWPVHHGYYRWVDTLGPVGVRFSLKTGECLGPPSRDDEPEAYRLLVHPQDCPETYSHEPLRVSGLFLTFAGTEPTEAGILAFADRFGALSGGRYIVTGPAARELFATGVAYIDPYPPKDTEKVLVGGELLTTWRKEIEAMRRAVFLWNLVGRGDEGSLRAHVAWVPGSKGGQSVVYRPDPQTPWPRTPGARRGVVPLAYVPPPPAARAYPSGELHQPVWDFIGDEINWRVQGTVSPQVGWDYASGRPALSFVPETLLGAIWLQFAQAVVGDADYRACGECGRIFEVSRTASRADRLFCSGACRSKAYRARKGRAREMFAGGKSVKEIAEALDCKPEAVKGWVKGVQREE
jgi:hypothetical protein